MEIKVKGSKVKTLTPDQIVFSFDFYYKKYTYEETLEYGSQKVMEFINYLESKGISSNDMKTRSYRVSEERKYDNTTNKYYPDGFSFNQSAVLKLDFSKKLLATMMEDISKLDNPPKYYVSFSVKDEKSARDELLKAAYEDAKEQAQSIAEAAGLNLRECAKVSFEPFEKLEYRSNTGFEGVARAMKMDCAASSIETSFTPEDIEVSETIYCLWITE